MSEGWRACALWLASAAMLWAIAGLVARIPTATAAAVTDGLFVLALSFTGVALLAATIHASPRPRLTALRAGALTCGVLGAVVLLELAAATRMVHWELVFKFVRAEDQHYLPDADLGFRHLPNAQDSGPMRSDVEVACGLPASRSDPVTVTYNERGYRNPAPLTRAEMVLIGDSYVEGSYVSDDETLAMFLEARLGQTVANLGVAGYGTAQELIVLERDALPLEPRVVIWFFFEGNDLYNDQDFENTLVVPREARASAWTEQHGWWRRSLIRNAHDHLRLLFSPFVPSFCPSFGILTVEPYRGQKVLFGPEAAFPWTDYEQGRWEKTKDTIREGRTLAHQRGAHLLLVYVPIKFRVYRDFIEPLHDELRHWTVWPLPELFAQFCRAEELACLDLTGPLREAVRDGGMPYALADSHWSPDGHRLIAEKLQERLASLGWVNTARE